MRGHLPFQEGCLSEDYTGRGPGNDAYGFRARQTWVLIPALPPTSCMTSEKSLTFLTLNFSFIKWGENIHFAEFLVNIRDKIHKVLGTQSPSKMVAANVISLV